MKNNNIKGKIEQGAPDIHGLSTCGKPFEVQQRAQRGSESSLGFPCVGRRVDIRPFPAAPDPP